MVSVPLDLVKKLLVLCFTPHSSWTKADREVLEQARELIRKQEENLEGASEKRDRREADEAERNKEPSSQESDDGIR